MCAAAFRRRKMCDCWYDSIIPSKDRFVNSFESILQNISHLFRASVDRTGRLGDFTTLQSICGLKTCILTALCPALVRQKSPQGLTKCAFECTILYY